MSPFLDLDRESGLTYMNARYYSADTRRFQNADPIRDGTNHYAYVGNDPLNWRDSWGLARGQANWNLSCDGL
jgi:RHS repeat-associated protein